MRTVAVVLAAGSGSRFGSASPKQLRLLGERNLIEHCALAFQHASGIDEVLIVTAADIREQVSHALTGFRKVADVIVGGASRTDSTKRALAWLADRVPDDTKVLFHDAARPLVDQRIIADCIAALDRWQAIGVVVPSSDTIVEVSEGTIQRVLPRQSLARCQTPQGFRLSVISRAYQLADADPDFAATTSTDDCGVVLRYLPEVTIGVVVGSERNLKITYADDLAVAHALIGPGSQPD
ncbi:MAG: 2-C-methyl-D-erythritol 4-phosphate cytidylyltransferase [Actinobacteria bacterium]|nr:2-C-methyl-D-erythritol 4-phosphate cytidylyltransferase [Actinomycetota bacterium]